MVCYMIFETVQVHVGSVWAQSWTQILKNINYTICSDSPAAETVTVFFHYERSMCRFTHEAQQLNLNLLRRRQIQSLSNVIKSSVFLHSLKGHTQSSLVEWKSFNKAAVLINPELHQSWVRIFDSEGKGLILFLLRVSSCFICFSYNIHVETEASF